MGQDGDAANGGLKGILYVSTTSTCKGCTTAVVQDLVAVRRGRR